MLIFSNSIPTLSVKTVTGQTASDVSIPIGASGLAYDSSTRNIYASYYGKVYVISGSTNAIVTNISLESYRAMANSLTYDSSNGNIYAVDTDLQAVLVISDSSNTVVHTTIIGGSPEKIVIDSSNRDIYVLNSDYFGTVSVLDPTTNNEIKKIKVGHNPFDITSDSSNGNIYVANRDDNTISVISGSTNTVVDTITIGDSLGSIAYNSANGYIYVTNGGKVSIISGSTNTVVDTIPLGGSPTNLAVDSSTGNIYVTDSTDNTISVISGSTNTTIDKISVGISPDIILVDSANGNIYMASLLGNKISVIHGRTQSTQQTSSSPAIDAATIIAAKMDGCKVLYGDDFNYDSSKDKCMPPSGSWDNPGTAYLTFQCQSKFGPSYNYDSSQNRCLPSGGSPTNDDLSKQCENQFYTDFYYDPTKNACLPPSGSWQDFIQPQSGVTDSHGVVTFQIGAQNIPIRLVDHTTGLPLSGFDTGFAIMPGEQWTGTLAIVDPSTHYPVQFTMLQIISSSSSQISPTSWENNFMPQAFAQIPNSNYDVNTPYDAAKNEPMTLDVDVHPRGISSDFIKIAPDMLEKALPASASTSKLIFERIGGALIALDGVAWALQVLENKGVDVAQFLGEHNMGEYNKMPLITAKRIIEDDYDQGLATDLLITAVTGETSFPAFVVSQIAKKENKESALQAVDDCATQDGKLYYREIVGYKIFYCSHTVTIGQLQIVPQNIECKVNEFCGNKPIAQAIGGAGGYEFNLCSPPVGEIPPGMNVETSIAGGGILAGTPTTEGTYTFGVCVKDTILTSSGTVTVTVNSACRSDQVVVGIQCQCPSGQQDMNGLCKIPPPQPVACGVGSNAGYPYLHSDNKCWTAPECGVGSNAGYPYLHSDNKCWTQPEGGGNNGGGDNGGGGSGGSCSAMRIHLCQYMGDLECLKECGVDK